MQGNGHQQMLSQAAAMLVSFPALVATELDAAALLALLRQGLAIARPPNTSILKPYFPLISRHVIRVVVNRILWTLQLHVQGEPVGR